MNLIEGLQEEMNRNRELLSEYQAIGPAGAFGAAFIKQDIAFAENAITTGDTIRMMKSYSKLKQNKLS